MGSFALNPWPEYVLNQGDCPRRRGTVVVPLPPLPPPAAMRTCREMFVLPSSSAPNCELLSLGPAEPSDGRWTIPHTKNDGKPIKRHAARSMRPTQLPIPSYLRRYRVDRIHHMPLDGFAVVFGVWDIPLSLKSCTVLSRRVRCGISPNTTQQRLRNGSIPWCRRAAAQSEAVTATATAETQRPREAGCARAMMTL